MGIGDIICEYIYGSFLLIKASLEAHIKTQKLVLDSLNTLFNTLMSWCRFVVDVTIKTIMDSIKVFQKWITDKVLNFDFSAICQGMFKCTALLDEVLDPNSLLSRTLKKYTNYNQKPQESLYAVIGDFNQFKETFCNFGLTYNFGISGIKMLLKGFKDTLEEFFQMIERNKERIRRGFQKYFDGMINCGIFDYLDTLKKFFDCVLIDTEICSNIRTANSFYNDSLAKLGLEESGSGYKLNSELSAYYLNAFDSRINQINNSKNELQKLIDSMLSPSQVSAANNAFNLAANIFPGGATWKDIQEGNFWKKNVCYQYFKMKTREFKNWFSEEENVEDIDTDTFLAAMKIDDTNGTISFNFFDSEGNAIIKSYSASDLQNVGELVKVNDEYYLNDDGNTYDKNAALYYTDENGEEYVVSTLQGAIQVTLHDNKDIQKSINERMELVGYTADKDVVKSM